MTQTRTTKTRCPDEAFHQEGPPGYLARKEWARKLSLTHTQQQCPGCGLWVIWERTGGTT